MPVCLDAASLFTVCSRVRSTAWASLHRALCTACSNQTQTARVYHNADSSPSKHEALTRCCFNVGPAPLAVGQQWNSIGSNPRVCWAPNRCPSTPTPPPTIIFSPADQGTFSKTAGQLQAYYNTWNWERGTYDINHLHILTCEGAVSRVSSVGHLANFILVRRIENPPRARRSRTPGWVKSMFIKLKWYRTIHRT